MSTPREIIAKNIAAMIKDGSFVNLGVGIPTLVGNFISPEITVILHGENGAAGMNGRLPLKGITDDGDTFLQWEKNHKGGNGSYLTGHKDLIDAGGDPVTMMPGSSNFDVCTAFAMARGGHLDMTVLGAMQVDQYGNIANWMIPGKRVTGMGGAMDILAGTDNVVIAMSLLSKSGEPKLLKECTLPYTARNCVKTVVTEKCILKVEDEHFVLTSLYPGVSIDEIKKSIDGNLIISEKLDTMLE